MSTQHGFLVPFTCRCLDCFVLKDLARPLFFCAVAPPLSKYQFIKRISESIGGKRNYKIHIIRKSSFYFLENYFTSLPLEMPIQLHRTPSSQRCESPSSVFFSDYIQDIPRDGQKQRQKPSLWMKQKHGRREKAKMIKRTDANVYTSTPNFWLFSIISIFPISPTKTYSLKQKNDMSQSSKVLLVTSTCTARPPPTFACRPDKKDLPRSIFGAPVCLKRDFSVESPQTCQHLLFWK